MDSTASSRRNSAAELQAGFEHASAHPAREVMADPSTSSSTSTTTSSSSLGPPPRPRPYEIAHPLAQVGRAQAQQRDEMYIHSLVASLRPGQTPYASMYASPLGSADPESKSVKPHPTRQEPRSTAKKRAQAQGPGDGPPPESTATASPTQQLESKADTQGPHKPSPVIVTSSPASPPEIHNQYLELVKTGMKNPVITAAVERAANKPGDPPARAQGSPETRNLQGEFENAARPNQPPVLAPPQPVAEPPEGRGLALALNLRNDPTLEARLAGCRQLAAARVERGEQNAGYLDRLHRAYLAHVPPHAHMHHERTLETVASLVDDNVASEQISQSSFWGRLRDFFSQTCCSEFGYVTSWYLAGVIGLELLDEDKDELAKILFPSFMASAGLLLGTRLLRKGDLYPTWTRPYAFDYERNVPVGTLEGGNFWRAVAAYWGFAPTLALISHYVQPSDDIADPAARKKALAIALTEARMKFNFISSALVACHRYFMLPRELTFLNALDPPGTPQDRMGEARRAMVGAIQELSAPRGTRFPGLEAARKTAMAPAGYLEHLGIGAARMLLLDEAWRAAKACYKGEPVTFSYSAKSATQDLTRLSLLFTAAVVLNMMRAWGSHPGEDGRKWNMVLDIAALPLLWGLGTALADRVNLDNDSIKEDNRYNEAQRLERLAPPRPTPPTDVEPGRSRAESYSQLDPATVTVVISPNRPRPNTHEAIETKQGHGNG